jgi:outer membrane protein TolC
MRWKRFWATLAVLLAAMSGCKQRCFLTESSYNRTVTTLLDGSELHPDLSAQPLTEPVGAPPTLENLDRKVRFISLAECVAIALEQGTVGQPSLLFPGTALDNLVQFAGPGSFASGGVSGSDAIRVFALQPAVFGSQIEAALSKFDAVFTSSLTYQITDTPISTAQQNIQAGGTNLSAIETTDATASMAIIKPLPTGGTAGITFNVPYEITNLPARVNPSYRPQLQFQFEQPLMQGFGVELNQIRASHPGSLLNPNIANTNPTSEGVLITRLRFDQERGDFERNVNQMLLNVEVAYWNLYGAYWTLYSREQGLRFAFEVFKLTKARYENGRVTAADFYQSRGQYEQFRAQRIQAISTVLENERQLRALLGLPIEDCTRLMPSDSPTLAPYRPDWCSSLEEALNKRPELYMARQDVKAAQMNLMVAKNQLLPDLRFLSTYDYNGLGSRLDGANTTGAGVNAFRNLAGGNFSDWSIQLRYNVPLGLRLGHVQVRQAQLGLARAMEILKDQEMKAQRFLGRYYEQISVSYEQIRANRAQREAFGEQLRARQQEYQAGRGTLDTLLEAQRFWADALANEYSSIVTYNNNLVGFEFAKGTILAHDNAVIAEGGLPCCAQVRAVDHEKQRTDALVLRERAAPAPANGPSPDLIGKGVSLPAALAATPPLKDVPVLPPAMPGQKTDLPAPTEAKPEEIFPTGPPVKLPSPALLPAKVLPPAAPGTGSASGAKPTATVLPPAPGTASASAAKPTAPPLPGTDLPAGSAIKLPPMPPTRPSDFGTARPD